MRLSTPAYLRTVRASALYDLLLTAPFATPWSFMWIHGQLSALNRLLGGAALPVFGPFHILFACLMGSVVLVWSALRLATPRVHLGRYDGATRLLFSSWMAWALAVTGTPLLWLFVVPEVIWGLVQWLPLARDQADGSGSSSARAAFTSAAPRRSNRAG
jgi:hypothetical protein